MSTSRTVTWNPMGTERKPAGDLIAVLNFPASEVGFPQGIPIHGFPIAVLVGIPLALLVVSIVRAAPIFGTRTDS